MCSYYINYKFVPLSLSATDLQDLIFKMYGKNAKNLYCYRVQRILNKCCFSHLSVLNSLSSLYDRVFYFSWTSVFGLILCVLVMLAA